jgi:hypothetical protein
MNPGTNELVADVEDLEKSDAKDFLKVPQHHTEDARRVLGDEKRIIVTPDTEAGRNLISWVKDRADRNKRRNQRKRQRQARKKNRQK